MIRAFIPVRGGSKSIPLKNIKLFCGKPLIYWSLLQLEEVELMDEIIVATDSDEIERVVREFNFEKVVIYRRSAENANDTASTESVMLEYVINNKIPESDVFVLVQATSPLTQAIHFKEALNMFLKSKYDSLLSCVRNYRFFWNEDGTSQNYDYRNRPRRQDFKGDLMENGAFYMTRVGDLLKSGNRLCGNIGIYTMPEYTGFEIDEPDDWEIMERLMYKYVLSNKGKKRIKLFLSDVDGVLTDGGMYYSEDGNELKRFNTKDGMAFELFRRKGIKTGIITSEITKIVENRAKKLKVDYLYQGKKEGGKLAAAIEICEKENLSLDEVSYIGDDINCLELLKNVGFAACPSDAMPEIKQIAGIHILTKRGGEGAVRELYGLLASNNLISDNLI